MGEVEADPRSLYVVDRVIHFGSMLDPDRDHVSDADLAIGVADNAKVLAAAGERIATSVFLTEMNGGRHPSGYLGEVSVFKLLKSRSRVLSLTRIGIGGTIGGLPPETPHKIIYERTERLWGTTTRQAWPPADRQPRRRADRIPGEIRCHRGRATCRPILEQHRHAPA
ncbi:hypothetical protein ACWDSF_35945 [Nocardia beijingensis]